MCDTAERSLEELGLSVKAKQDRLFALYDATWPDAFKDLQSKQHVDIVFTSNALDGNMLSASETATILERGIAVGGKSLEHNIQAFDHGEALEFAADIALKQNQADRHKPVRPGDLRMLNWQLGRRAPRDAQSTFAHLAGEEPHNWFENPPKSIVDLCSWLKTQPDTPQTAIQVHNRLIRAQPFVNDNGTTARLAMNLVLMRGGSPPVAIHIEDAPRYSSAIKGGDDSMIEKIVLGRLDQTLDRYIEAAEQFSAANSKPDREP